MRGCSKSFVWNEGAPNYGLIMNINGKVAVVTGGTKGIGRGIAEALVRAGVSVAICARKTQELEVTIDILNQLGEGTAIGIVCDVRDYGQVTGFIDQVVKRFGGVDILVNNAGVGYFGPVETMKPEEFRAVIETNLNAVFYCCQAVIPLMKERGWGYIINISSLAGANPHPKMAAYNASKFGLNGFSEALMQEVRHDGIKVSYIMPGSVNTGFGGDTPGEDKDWQLRPEDIAQVIIDLLHHPNRSLPSRVEIRPSKPPRK